MAVLPYILRRLLATLVVVVLSSFLVFGALRLAPGDPAIMLLGDFATEETLARTRRELGLDRPFVVQYFLFLKRVVRGDLGTSMQYRSPVPDLVFPAFKATLYLALPSLVLSSAIGILAGGLAAAKLRTWVDHLVSFLVVLGIATPGFWLAILLVVLFALRLRWLPSSGYGLGANLVLPVIALTIEQLALTSQIMKGSMSDVLLERYIQTAHAKGLSNGRVLWGHALRNSLIPVVTVVALRFGALLGGAVTIEVVFGWPGLGRLVVAAALARDYPIVIAGALLLSVAFVGANLMADIVYGYVDPRIRHAQQNA